MCQEQMILSRHLGSVGLLDVAHGNTIHPAVLTAPRSEITHVLHDLKHRVVLLAAC